MLPTNRSSPGFGNGADKSPPILTNYPADYDNVVSVAAVDDKYIDDNGKLYVQIAAFNTEENALKLIDDLREKKFHSVRIHVDNNKGKLLYRVRIGPVPTDNVAEKVLAQLKEINLNNAKIIRYN